MNNQRLEALIGEQRDLRQRLRKRRETRVERWMNLATGFMAILHRHRQERGQQPTDHQRRTSAR
jgi:hypothetical protein